MAKNYTVSVKVLGDEDYNVGPFERFQEAEESARSESTPETMSTIIDDEGVIRGRYLNGVRIKDSGMPVY